MLSEVNIAELLIAVVLTLVSYVAGLFTDDVRELVERLRERFGPPRVGFSGHYHTKWDKGGNRPQRELVQILERRGRILCRVLYAIDASTTYEAKGTLYVDGAVSLTWENPEKSIAGTVHMAKKSSGFYEGRWTGESPTARTEVKGGEWRMRRIRPTEVPVPDLPFKPDEHRRALAELVLSHERRFNDSTAGWSSSVTLPTGEVVNLQIHGGVFDPTLGSGSRRLLEYASNFNALDVLDLGFGSGLFGIFFAKYRNSRVVDTDSNETAVHCARANAARNGVSENCEFLHGDLYGPLYAAHRLSRAFDLIIVNLPFSRRELVAKALKLARIPKSRIEQYEEMFSSSKPLLLNVLYGASFFLKPGGALLLLTGGSADLHCLREASKFSGLSLARTAADIFSGKSEELMVVALEKLSDTPRSNSSLQPTRPASP